MRDLPADQNAAVASLGLTHVPVDEFDVVSQQCILHHYRHDADGTARHDSDRFRYAWPAELDLMARLAGMRLENRYADWSHNLFGTHSVRRISVWRKD